MVNCRSCFVQRLLIHFILFRVAYFAHSFASTHLVFCRHLINWLCKVSEFDSVLVVFEIRFLSIAFVFTEVEINTTEKLACDGGNKAALKLETDDLDIWMHSYVFDKQELAGPEDDKNIRLPALIEQLDSMYLARSKPSHHPFLTGHVDLESVINKPNYAKTALRFGRLFRFDSNSRSKKSSVGPKRPARQAGSQPLCSCCSSREI